VITLPVLLAVGAGTLVLVVSGVALLGLRVWALSLRVEALEAGRVAGADADEDAVGLDDVPRLHEVQSSSQPATCSHPPHQRQDASTLRKRQFFCHACRATVPDRE
jgi:hypothetical protein